MISSASQASQASEAPEQIMDFDTFWKQNNMYGTISPEDQLMVKLMNVFTGEGKRVHDLYDAYVKNTNLRNEAKATQSARAWDEYMDNTKYQRTFKDLEASGVNPYLLINGGGSPAVGSSSSPKASYSLSGTKDASSGSTKGRDLALVVLAIARLAATLA